MVGLVMSQVCLDGFRYSSNLTINMTDMSLFSDRTVLSSGSQLCDLKDTPPFRMHQQLPLFILVSKAHSHLLLCSIQYMVFWVD